MRRSLYTSLSVLALLLGAAPSPAAQNVPAKTPIRKISPAQPEWIMTTMDGLVHHSDRGVQYSSEAYRQRRAAAGEVPSMSPRGNCYDNAVMETFWSSLKLELVPCCQFTTRALARIAVFEWIEIFYPGARPTLRDWPKSPVRSRSFPPLSVRRLALQVPQGIVDRLLVNEIRQQ